VKAKLEKVNADLLTAQAAVADIARRLGDPTATAVTQAQAKVASLTKVVADTVVELNRESTIFELEEATAAPEKIRKHEAENRVKRMASAVAAAVAAAPPPFAQRLTFSGSGRHLAVVVQHCSRLLLIDVAEALRGGARNLQVPYPASAPEWSPLLASLFSVGPSFEPVVGSVAAAVAPWALDGYTWLPAPDGVTTATAPTMISWHPTDAYLLAAYDNRLFAWHTKDWRLVETWQLPSTCVAVCWHPILPRFLVAHKQALTILLIDLVPKKGATTDQYITPVIGFSVVGTDVQQEFQPVAHPMATAGPVAPLRVVVHQIVWDDSGRRVAISFLPSLNNARGRIDVVALFSSNVRPKDDGDSSMFVPLGYIRGPKFPVEDAGHANRPNHPIQLAFRPRADTCLLAVAWQSGHVTRYPLCFASD
jgi:hypothetical protein